MLSSLFRRRVLIAATAVLATLAVSACGNDSGSSGGDSSKGALAMSFGGLDVPIWNAELKYMKPLVEKAGYEFLSDDPQWDVQKQVTDWQGWIQRGDVKAIMGFPVQADAIVPVTAEAKAAGIRVVGYANTWEGTEGSLGSDYEGDGEMLGKRVAEWINENLPGQKNVEVAIIGEKTSDLGRGRLTGMKKGLAGASVKIYDLAAQARDEAANVTKSQLVAHPNTKIWLGTSDGVLLGSYQTVIDSGVAANDPTYAFGTLDATNETLDVIKKPDTIWRFGYSISAKTIAEANVKLLLQAAEGKKVDDIVLKYDVVTAANADQYYSE